MAIPLLVTRVKYVLENGLLNGVPEKAAHIDCSDDSLSTMAFNMRVFITNYVPAALHFLSVHVACIHVNLKIGYIFLELPEKLMVYLKISIDLYYQLFTDVQT